MIACMLHDCLAKDARTRSIEKLSLFKGVYAALAPLHNLYMLTIV